VSSPGVKHVRWIVVRERGGSLVLVTPRSSRAQANVVGFVLLVGLTIVSVTGVVVIGAPALGSQSGIDLSGKEDEQVTVTVSFNGNSDTVEVTVADDEGTSATDTDS
jgi:xanthine/uracil/vitamin C permease (AzgA family)